LKLILDSSFQNNFEIFRQEEECFMAEQEKSHKLKLEIEYEKNILQED